LGSDGVLGGTTLEVFGPTMGHGSPLLEDGVGDLLEVVVCMSTTLGDLDAELLVELVVANFAEGPADAELPVFSLGCENDTDGLTLAVLDVLDNGVVGHVRLS
jgi:hypothetical protein